MLKPDWHPIIDMNISDVDPLRSFSGCKSHHVCAFVAGQVIGSACSCNAWPYSPAGMCKDKQYSFKQYLICNSTGWKARCMSKQAVLLCQAGDCLLMSTWDHSICPFSFPRSQLHAMGQCKEKIIQIAALCTGEGCRYSLPDNRNMYPT